MAFRPTAPKRLVLRSLAVAGLLAGSAGAAAAQYYAYEEEEFYPRRQYERYAPLPPAPIPPRAIGRIAARDFGLAQVDRLVRTRSSYVIDGQNTRGGRTRLIFDLYSGDLLGSVALPDPRRETPRVARVDPRDDDRPAPRLVPRPPERPPSLKPPGQASAPATIRPASPAAPPRPPEVETPVEKPPASASAPATTVPVAPAAPPVPTPGPVNPESGAAKPTLVNPQDVRGAGEIDHQPPLARADPSGISVPPVDLPVDLPAVQIEDMSREKPLAETPVVPAAPLD